MVLHRLTRDVVHIEVVRVDTCINSVNILPVVAQHTANPLKRGLVLKAELKSRNGDQQ